MAQLLERTYSLNKVRTLTYLFVFIFAAFCLPFLLYPLVSLIGVAIQHAFSQPQLFTPLFYSSLYFSLIQASISTLLSGVLGTTLAFFLIENGKGTKSFFWKMGLLSFSLPSIVIVLALFSFWGHEGLGVSLFGWRGILLAHVMMNYPLFMRFVGEAWLATHTEQEMSGLSLGASRLQLFFYVTLPKIRPTLLSAALLCFTYCFCSFIPVSLLGGDPRYSTFELNIYQALKFENDYGLAAFFAITQLFILLPFFLLFKRFSQSNVTVASGQRVKIYTIRNNFKLMTGIFLSLLLLVLSYGPLGVLLSLSLKNVAKLDFLEFFDAIKNSLSLALYCLALSLPVALSAAYIQKHFPALSKGVSYLVLLPLFIPVMLLTAALSNSFSFAVTFFRESFWAVAVIQATVALPLLSRILNDGYNAISSEMELSAFSLGASPFQVFMAVELPLLLRFILLGAGVVLCFSLGEVSSLLLFGSSQGPTLSLLIFQKLGKYALTEAYALGALLMVLMGTILWGIEKCKPS